MEKKEDLKNRIRKLKIGGRIEQPIERLAVVRQYAYILKLLENKSYVTSADRKKRIVTVTRVS